jgi:hypothetical protein
VPADPERLAAIRSSFHWVWFSYVPLTAGIAWLVFAVRQWAGHRGLFLGISGVMLGVVASAAIVFPFIRVAAPGRRIAGMSFGTYTLVTTLLGVVIAVVPCHPRVRLSAALNQAGTTRTRFGAFGSRYGKTRPADHFAYVA